MELGGALEGVSRGEVYVDWRNGLVANDAGVVRFNAAGFNAGAGGEIELACDWLGALAS